MTEPDGLPMSSDVPRDLENGAGGFDPPIPAQISEYGRPRYPHLHYCLCVCVCVCGHRPGQDANHTTVMRHCHGDASEPRFQNQSSLAARVFILKMK